jgi:bifunctional non-homologous end joining protein LigD
MAEERRYGRRTVRLERLEKVLFPDDGITKGDLVEYYEAASTPMLPGLRDRPLSMKRYPDGIAAQAFFQKRRPAHFPDWIRSVEVESEKGPLTQVVSQDEATLAYLAGQACIEFHPWLSRVPRLDRPDQLIFDLDPGGDDFEPVRRAALDLRDLLDELGLAPFARTTGSRGLHVVVPLQARRGFDEVRDLAREVAVLLASQRPDERTTEMRKAKRAGRVFVDWLRNGYAQTSIASYSVRARPGAPVAAPLGWEEVADPALHARSFHLGNIRERLRSGHDPWHDFGSNRRALGEAWRRLRAMRPEAEAAGA